MKFSPKNHSQIFKAFVTKQQKKPWPEVTRESWLCYCEGLGSVIQPPEASVCSFVQEKLMGTHIKHSARSFIHWWILVFMLQHPLTPPQYTLWVGSVLLHSSFGTLSESPNVLGSPFYKAEKRSPGPLGGSGTERQLKGVGKENRPSDRQRSEENGNAPLTEIKWEVAGWTSQWEQTAPVVGTRGLKNTVSGHGFHQKTDNWHVQFTCHKPQ